MAAERLTIDELAHRSGTAASTIRMYQTRGVLPPPTREGRVGFYGDGHLARLRLVGQLQDDGFSLASIRQLVDAWEHGRGLDAVLGLEAQIAGTWAAETPLVLRPDELAARFPDGALSPELMQRALALGLVGVDGGNVVVQSPKFLEIGAQLAHLGIPLAEILDEYERLQTLTATIAEQFTQLFERHLWEPFVARGLPADDVRDLTGVLQRLSALAEGVVDVTLRQSLKGAAAGFLAGQAERLQDAGVLDAVRPLATAAGLELGAP
jgi:DNA-binding transcriptional MerR regulator